MAEKKRPYEFFSVAADIMVLRKRAHWELLLIERKHPPFQGAWALPGGFVDRDEDALTAAHRELREETGLVCRKLVEFGTFSAPRRDPRRRTLTVAYYAVLRGAKAQATAGDDAERAQWFSVRRLPQLAFDHKEMIRQGLRRHRRDLKCRSLRS